MPSIDSILGKIPQSSTGPAKSSYQEKQIDCVNFYPPTTTHYANTDVFSRRSYRRHSPEVGKLYKQVFKED